MHFRFRYSLGMWRQFVFFRLRRKPSPRPSSRLLAPGVVAMAVLSYVRHLRALDEYCIILFFPYIWRSFTSLQVELSRQLLKGRLWQ